MAIKQDAINVNNDVNFKHTTRMLILCGIIIIGTFGELMNVFLLSQLRYNCIDLRVVTAWLGQLQLPGCMLNDTVVLCPFMSKLLRRGHQQANTGLPEC